MITLVIILLLLYFVINHNKKINIKKDIKLNTLKKNVKTIDVNNVLIYAPSGGNIIRNYTPN
jgi:hypothetical protein